MGRLSTRWRRFWGIRPGELRPPVRIVGRRHAIGEPVSGSHGRGWALRHGRLLSSPVESELGSPAVIVPDWQADPSAFSAFPFSVVADEQIPDEVREHARKVVLRVAGFSTRPVLHARVVLRLHSDPALERPAVAKASLDVSGRPVRAHVAARRMPEAIDLLENRLRRNLEDLDELARAHRHETGELPPGEWRHGSLPASRPEHFPRPPEEREIVRRKTFALSALTPEQAALEMRLQDFDFHLFTNTDTGEENVVYRRPDGTTALMQITPSPAATPPAFTVDPVSAQVMLVDGAIRRMNLTGEPFVFFVDAQTRRGNLLYLRYDGHYGLIEPLTSV